MFCPKCGQQQVSDNTRFCSRCGFSISELAEWLAGDSVLVRRQKAPASLPSPRRKGIKRGGKLMFLACAMAPIFLVLSLIFDNPFPLIAPFIIFCTGVLLMLYSLIFGEEIPQVKSEPTQTSVSGTMSASVALPSASNIRVSSLSEQRMKTAEIINPPSVTEHTTKLLDRDQMSSKDIQAS